jgi:hypothetical protein
LDLDPSTGRLAAPMEVEVVGLSRPLRHRT